LAARHYDKKHLIDPNSVFSIFDERLSPVEKFMLVRLVHLQFSFDPQANNGTGKIFVRNGELGSERLIGTIFF